MEEVKVVETKRRNPAILHSGYRYTKKRVFKNSNILWTCCNRSCSGTLTTGQRFELLETKTSHTCVPNEAKNQVEVCLQNVKKRAREELLPIPQIYREEITSVKDAGLDFVVNVPELSSVKGRFYRERHRALGIDVLPKTRGDVILRNEMTQYLLADDGANDERIIIFAANQGKMLAKATEVFMDGTFKSCCPLFDQLYTIHVDLGSTMEETQIIPVIYALLPNRKEATYKRFFEIILSKVEKFSPRKIHIDFEKAAINALCSVFPKSDIKGCNFHYNQALWRKIQELQLVREYKDNEEIRKHLLRCAALAHLPKNLISDAWLEIMEIAPNNLKVVRFNDYFVEQWLDNEWFWVCYGERHRTTNAVEGWHNKLNRRVGKSHPNIYELIKVLAEDIQYHDMVQQRCDLYMPTPKRAKKYTMLDERIKNTLDDLRVSGDINKALNRLIHIVQFECI